MFRPLTSPAIWQAKPEASKREILPMPDRPARMSPQPSSTLLPTGLTRPSPVTTTRRRVIAAAPKLQGMRKSGSSRLLVLYCVVDRQLHGGDLLCFLVGNLDTELVLEGHHQFDRVER